VSGTKEPAKEEQVTIDFAFATVCSTQLRKYENNQRNITASVNVQNRKNSLVEHFARSLMENRQRDIDKRNTSF
jgi:N-acetylneuraminate synthase